MSSFSYLNFLLFNKSLIGRKREVVAGSKFKIFINAIAVAGDHDEWPFSSRAPKQKNISLSLPNILIKLADLYPPSFCSKYYDEMKCNAFFLLRQLKQKKEKNWGYRSLKLHNLKVVYVKWISKCTVDRNRSKMTLVSSKSFVFIKEFPRVFVKLQMTPWITNFKSCSGNRNLFTTGGRQGRLNEIMILVFKSTLAVDDYTPKIDSFVYGLYSAINAIIIFILQLIFPFYV